MERITLAPGAHINVLPAEKFNRCRISINFIWPAAREWATAEALLPLVLERGYQGCPDMTELSKKLARLYGAALSVDGTMSGQSRVLTVSLSGIRDAFALASRSAANTRTSPSARRSSRTAWTACWTPRPSPLKRSSSASCWRARSTKSAAIASGRRGAGFTAIPPPALSATVIWTRWTA